MAALTLQSYTLEPLNPDGTVNANLPTLSGSTPPSSGVDFAFMGQRFKLELEFELTGTYPDSSAFNVNSLFVRYTPAMFVEKFTTFISGIIPSNGYTLVIPNSSASTYPMALVMQRGETVLSNENGTCFLEVIDSTHFKIIHSFRLVSDTEDYLSSVIYENQTRLTKNSVYAASELTNTRTSVFNTEKAYNAVIATQKVSYKIFASEFSIPFSASFYGQNQEGNAVFPMTVVLERNSTEVSSLSPYEDTLVKIQWVDNDVMIMPDEAVVILTKRTSEGNQAGFEKDLQIYEVKLVTDVSGGTIIGPFKGPVEYIQSDGITSVSFIIDKDYIDYGIAYDIHAIGFYGSGPSDIVGIHGVSQVSSESEALDIGFEMDCNIWSKQGNHGNSFSCCVMERLITSCEINYQQYFDFAYPPFSNFEDDFKKVRFELKNAVTEAVIHSGQLQKGFFGSINSNSEITVLKDTEAGKYYFASKPFRVGYENFQDLPNLGTNTTSALNQYVIEWTVEFSASGDEVQVLKYVFECQLEVRPYENQNTEVSYSPKVFDIIFRDPQTGLPISAWCDLESVLVTAQVSDWESNDWATTYCNVYVDNFPYGTLPLNNFALQEENPQSHATPPYIEFPELESDRITFYNFDENTGVVSFLLDISELTGEEKNRISIQAYQSND